VKPYVKELLALSCSSIHLSSLNSSVSTGWILLYRVAQKMYTHFDMKNITL